MVGAMEHSVALLVPLGTGFAGSALSTTSDATAAGRSAHGTVTGGLLGAAVEDRLPLLEEGGDALGDFNADVVLSLSGAGAKVRRQNNPGIF